MRFDLHLHTTASDGQLDPARLVRAAHSLGLAAIAITDHDTTAAVESAIDAAQGTGLRVIPGVELSATHHGRDVHILGYFIDPTDRSLQNRLTELRAARLERARTMVEALHGGGYDITLEQVLSLAEGGSVGRSHVARALVSLGHVEDVGVAFDGLIGRGRPFYMPKPVTAPEAVVRTILDAGGLAVLAHPGVTCVDDLIPGLVAAGLSGIEAYHADHTPLQCRTYARRASDLGLLVTGGSDFHGPTAPGAGIGEVDMPDSVLTRLLEIGLSAAHRG